MRRREATPGPKRTLSRLRLFWWTLGVLGLLLAGLIALSLSGPDAPFTYILK